MSFKNSDRSQITDTELESLTILSKLDDQNCSICKCDINERKIRMLPCSHAFHENCIFQWLKIHPSCPLCRHQLKKINQYTSDEQIDYWTMIRLEQIQHANILPGTDWESGPSNNSRSRIRDRNNRG
ncbi:hypothetical protein PVAND_011035 [Polypedilum vanderplanki]|uniref:RING-type domain-containing protein n=1 Tax=Polypedilum vanderplanki TaxID=319348 RepID=A0A9J6CIS3_POLVA|nr:hypothetical protein PVAND_011035 [Polypedilum vanderplanki]